MFECNKVNDSVYDFAKLEVNEKGESLLVRITYNHIEKKFSNFGYAFLKLIEDNVYNSKELKQSYLKSIKDVLQKICLAYLAKKEL